MPLQTLDLTFSPDDDAAVRAQWRALRDEDVPSLADHRGASNAPHLTLLSAQQIPDEAVRFAELAFSAALPITVEIAGTALFGAHKFVLAHLIAPSAGLRTMVERVAALVPGGAFGSASWTPHVSLANRLTAQQVARALDALAAVPRPDKLTVHALRRWDPATSTSALLASTS